MNKSGFIIFMIDSGVLTFGDFTTKSGRKTPYFINTGNFRTGAQADILSTYYAELVHDTLGSDFDVLFGPAYKGIPLVTLTAAALWRVHGIDKPYSFNRKEAKDHGEGGSMVGYKLKDGDRVIFIEDVITAGTAVRETLPMLKSVASVAVEHMFICADRMEKGYEGRTAVQEMREQFGISVHAIVNAGDVLAYIKENKIVSDDIIGRMENYLEEYCVK